MDDSYQYTTPEQQIQKLGRQRLAFDNEAQAKIILETYGYYNIINGYRDPYITRDYGKKIYNTGVSFEQIFSLFCLDHNIRNAIMLSMVDLEEHLRAVVSNVIAKNFGTNHKEYLRKNHYRGKEVSDSYFSRESILGTLNNLADNSRKEPLLYYRKKYGAIPPWILLKGTYFSTLVNYIRLFKGPQRSELVSALYGISIDEPTIDTYKDRLSDSLFLCLEYRNLTVHGGRVYNHIPKKGLRLKSKSESGLTQLLYALNGFTYKQPFIRLKSTVNHSLNEYCHNYPDDVPRLEQAIGITLTVESKVWANSQTGKYHTNPHCSGSKELSSVTLKFAIDKGYVKCKKCCNNMLPIA